MTIDGKENQMAPVLEEQLVAAPDKSVLYMSRRTDLRLTKTPRYPVFGASGQKVGEHPGEVLAFRDGQLRVPRDGEFALEDGRTVDAAGIQEWLEKHRLNGDREEGFWRVEPVAPAPTQAELSALLEAAWDEDRLVALIEQEKAGWGREDVLKPAGEALERLRQVKAEAAAQAEAAAKAAAEAPAEPRTGRGKAAQE